MPYIPFFKYRRRTSHMYNIAKIVEKNAKLSQVLLKADEPL